MHTGLIRDITAEHEEFLRDESRRVGFADKISFPRDESEILEVLKAAAKEKLMITIQGARTGITAGAVPQGGIIVNLNKMNRITGLRCSDDGKAFFLKVQPGVLLSELREALSRKSFNIEGWDEDSIKALKCLKASKKKFIFMPDPTETSASIGGMVACNASGACSFMYSATRKHIRGTRIVFCDGGAVYLQRGLQKCSGRLFNIKREDGKIIEGEIPGYKMPSVKNASGYYCEDDMDLIDLFIGAEGTLGIISEIELILLEAPESIAAMLVFFDSSAKAVKYVRAVRGEKPEGISAKAVYRPAAIEFFNWSSLNLIRKVKRKLSVFKDLYNLSEHYNTAIYVEYHGGSDEEAFSMFTEAAKLIDCCGGDMADTWVALKPWDLERLKFFRHSIPEAVNMLIDDKRKKDPGLTKLGTDMAVPDGYLEDILSIYDSGLREYGLEYASFGHIGNNHIHVNIIPRDMDDYARGKELYMKWAKEVLDMGGTVSAEHGIGKLKIDFLKYMYKETGLEEMKAVKQTFDPGLRMNHGNLFKV